MSEFKLKDIYRTKAELQFSNSGYIRIDFQADENGIKPEDGKFTFAMTKNQAIVLMASLSEMINKFEDYL